MSKALKIGIVANTAFNIYNFRLSLILALKQEGHHVFAIAPYDDYVPLLKENNIDYIEIKNLSRKGTNPITDLKLLNELRRLYKLHQLDAVLQYTIKPNIYGTLAARLTKTIAICTVTGLGYTFLNKSTASKIARRLYRFAFSFAHKVLFQNEDDLAVFVQNNLVDKAKTQIVPGSGIDVEKFQPQFCLNMPSSQLPFAKTKHQISFLLIARLLKDKGVYEFVEAAKQMLQTSTLATFHLLGDIDTNNPSAIDKATISQWENEGIIKYYGFTKDTRPYICAADCIVLPSYREGMPRVILESMAMGKPSITTDAPGCKDAIVHQVSGWICKAQDSNSLRDAMQMFLELDEVAKLKIGLNARNRAEEIFSTTAVNLFYINLLKNL